MKLNATSGAGTVDRVDAGRSRSRVPSRLIRSLVVVVAVAGAACAARQAASDRQAATRERLREHEARLQEYRQRLELLESRLDWQRPSRDSWARAEEARSDIQTLLPFFTTQGENHAEFAAARDQLLQTQTAFERAAALKDSWDRNVQLADAYAAMRRALNSADVLLSRGDLRLRVFFKLDRTSQDGRTVPGGLNLEPPYADTLDKTIEALKTYCGRQAEVRLYGFSCDLGSDDYDTELARARAGNLRKYLEAKLAEDRFCDTSGLAFEEAFGAIVRLPRSATRLGEDRLKQLRERNRHVALYVSRPK